MNMSSHRFPPGRLKNRCGSFPSPYGKNVLGIASHRRLLELQSVEIPTPFANRHTMYKQSLKASEDSD